jgi:hypothetical protein
MVWARKADNPQLSRSIPQRGWYFVHNLSVERFYYHTSAMINCKLNNEILNYGRNSFISDPQDLFGRKQSVVLFVFYARVSS